MKEVSCTAVCPALIYRENVTIVDGLFEHQIRFRHEVADLKI